MASGLALAACATRDAWPLERLDSRTAVHATILAEPWVYAHEARMLAANARDYLNVGVVETNRAGERAYWLGVVAWSTIDRRAPAGGIVPPGQIRLVHAKGTIELTPVPAGRGAVGLDAPAFVGDAGSFAESWYPLSVEQVRQLGQGPPQAVELPEAGATPVIYDVWRARKKPIAEFIKAVGL